MAIEQYRQIIQQLILERAQRQPSQITPEGEGIEKQAIIDTEHDHYLLLHTGWRGNRRTHGVACIST